MCNVWDESTARDNVRIFCTFRRTYMHVQNYSMKLLKRFRKCSSLGGGSTTQRATLNDLAPHGHPTERDLNRPLIAILVF